MNKKNVSYFSKSYLFCFYVEKCNLFSDGKDDSNAPVINLIIKSPRDSRPSPKSNKTNGTHQTEQTSFRTMKGPNNQQSNQQEVQVQISLSRLDDRSPKVFTGVWKPDASTIQRLQGS